MTLAHCAPIFGRAFDTLAGDWSEATLARWATTADAA
jgi:hypothetical protein